MLYLQYVSTGGTTVHVVIIWGHLYTLHNPLQLTQVAVSGHHLASLWAQLPDTQSVTEERYVPLWFQSAANTYFPPVTKRSSRVLQKARA